MYNQLSFNPTLGNVPLAPLQTATISQQLQQQSNPVTGIDITGGGYQPVSTSFTQPTTDKPGFFQEGGGAGIALGAIKTLGSLWNSYQQTNLAKKSLAFQTKAYDTNLANQTKSYNTALEGRIRARYATEGKSQQQADSYYQANRL